MKKFSIIILSLVISVLIFTSCETLFSDNNTESSGSYLRSSKESPENKFFGTWVYTNKDYGWEAFKRGEDLPIDMEVEFSFSFHTGGTGMHLAKYHSSAYNNDYEDEFLWSVSPISEDVVIIVMAENTSINYRMIYETSKFLIMNDRDFGRMHFVKQE